MCQGGLPQHGSWFGPFGVRILVGSLYMSHGAVLYSGWFPLYVTWCGSVIWLVPSMCHMVRFCILVGSLYLWHSGGSSPLQTHPPYTCSNCVILCAAVCSL